MPEDKQVKEKQNGITLSSFIIFLIVIVILLSAVLVFTNVRITSNQISVAETIDSYIVCGQSISSIKDASDYLTSEVREYIVKGDVTCIKKYFDEATVKMSRQNALEEALKKTSEQGIIDALHSALEYSNSLMKTEIYAFRLAAEGYHADMTAMPREIKSAEILAVDRILKDQDKKDKAQSMVYSEEYQTIKEQIYLKLDEATDITLKSLIENQRKATQALNVSIIEQRVVVGLLVCSIIVSGIFMITMILFPLRNNVSFIKNQELLPIKGSRELKILAKNFNRMYMKLRSKNEQLSFNADHDPLTKLKNRGVFDETIQNGLEVPIALMIIDIDKFKSINDTHGHDCGDRALKKVAEAISNSFRSEDIICRIGGDEFAVIMHNVTPKQKDMIEKKVHLINEGLQEQIEGLPLMTLSIGIAFGEQNADLNKVFKYADESMYIVKNSGKNGFKFYE